MLTLPLSSLQEGQDGDRRNVRRIADRQAVVKAFVANLDRKIIAAPRALNAISCPPGSVTRNPLQLWPRLGYVKPSAMTFAISRTLLLCRKLFCTVQALLTLILYRGSCT